MRHISHDRFRPIAIAIRESQLPDIQRYQQRLILTHSMHANQKHSKHAEQPHRKVRMKLGLDEEAKKGKRRFGKGGRGGEGAGA